MGDRDEFDKIIEHLDLDLTFPDEPAEPGSTGAPSAERSAQHPGNQARDDHARSPDVDEEFYRRVTPAPSRGWGRNTTLAWTGIAGSPVALVLCTLLGFIAPRSVVVALSLVFVASAIYLITQLPEQGPARGDDPDDGAVL